MTAEKGAIRRVLIFLFATVASAGTARAQDDFAATIKALIVDGSPPGARLRIPPDTWMRQPGLYAHRCLRSNTTRTRGSGPAPRHTP